MVVWRTPDEEEGDIVTSIIKCTNKCFTFERPTKGPMVCAIKNIDPECCTNPVKAMVEEEGWQSNENRHKDLAGKCF